MFACFVTILTLSLDNYVCPDAGASILACSDTYRGASPASELETQALQNEALRLGPTMATSIHFHTYSQYWLIPWGSYASDGVTCNYADDHDEMVINCRQFLLHCVAYSIVFRIGN